MEKKIITVPTPDLVDKVQQAAGKDVMVICVADFVSKCEEGIKAEQVLKDAGLKNKIPKRKRAPRKKK